MKISVVMAVYNGEKYLVQQMDSIRNQTRPPDEMLLADDQSSDSSVEIIRKYIQKYNLPWKVTINKERKGFGGNFFSLMNQCSGDLIFPSDQDDVWRLDKIERMSEIMEKTPEISVLISEYRLVPSTFSCSDPNKKCMSPLSKNSSVVRLTLHDVITKKDKSCPFAGMAQCIRFSFYFDCFKDVKRFPLVHDRLMVLLAADESGFYKLNDFTVFHRVHSNNTSGINRSFLNRVFDFSISDRLKLLESFKNEDQSYLESGVILSECLRNYLTALSKYQNEKFHAIQTGDGKRLFRVFWQNRKKGHISLISFLSDCRYVLLRKILN